MNVDADLAARALNVTVSGLSKTFGSKKAPVRVLDNLSLEVEAGEMLVLLGPSGCGKTTLLRCVVGLEQPDTGRIQLGGRPVVDAERGVVEPPEKRGVGMVFQNYALWPHMTVEQNVAFPLKSRGQKAALAGGRVKEALEIVQCGHLATRYPAQLSGGQQQRIALARALASRPGVMLMDEPLSNLDALLRIDLRAQLHQLHQRFGFTGIYVTHDQVEAISLGTRVVVMKSGRMEQIGPPAEIYGRPANEYVAGFLGMRNTVDCSLSDDGTLVSAVGSTSLPANFIRPGQYRLRCRPSDMTLRVSRHAGSDDSLLWLPGGRVVDCLRYGEMEEYVVAMGQQTVLIEVHRSLDIPSDQAVEVGLNLRAARFYDGEGKLAETRFMQ